jgi:hypothetical protein
MTRNEEDAMLKRGMIVAKHCHGCEHERAPCSQTPQLVKVLDVDKTQSGEDRICFESGGAYYFCYDKNPRPIQIDHNGKVLKGDVWVDWCGKLWLVERIEGCNGGTKYVSMVTKGYEYRTERIEMMIQDGSSFNLVYREGQVLNEGSNVTFGTQLNQAMSNLSSELKEEIIKRLEDRQRQEDMSCFPETTQEDPPPRQKRRKNPVVKENPEVKENPGKKDRSARLERRRRRLKKRRKERTRRRLAREDADIINTVCLNCGDLLPRYLLSDHQGSLECVMEKQRRLKEREAQGKFETWKETKPWPFTMRYEPMRGESKEEHLDRCCRQWEVELEERKKERSALDEEHNDAS